MKIYKEQEYKTLPASDFIHDKLACDDFNHPFLLAGWEEDIIQFLEDPGTLEHFDIKRIVIITPRMTGATFFCKILHWLKPEGVGTYIISENLDKSNMIKRMPIKTKNIVITNTNSGKLGIDCFYPVSFASVKKNGLKPIKQYNNKFVTSEMQTKAAQNEKIHVMLDLEKYDKEIIDTVEALNPDFMTIVIKVDDDTYNDIKEYQIPIDSNKSNIMFYDWLRNSMHRDDTYVTIPEDNCWYLLYM